MRKPLVIGASIGCILGAIIFAGYATAGWWVCTTLPACPGHWLPYLLTFAIGVAVFTVFGAAVAMGLRFLYRITRVEADEMD